MQGWDLMWLRYLPVTQTARPAAGRWLWVAGSPVTQQLPPAGLSQSPRPPAAPVSGFFGYAAGGRANQHTRGGTAPLPWE